MAILMSSQRVRRPVTRLHAAAALSLLAAVVHGTVAPQHYHEWWVYGVFFLALSSLQAAFAVAILNRPSRPLCLAGIAVNAAVAGIYVVSRTAGVPIGPHAGHVETVGPLDLACTAAEVGLVVVLLGALLRASSLKRPRLRLRTLAPVALIVAAALPGASASTSPLAAGPGSAPSHESHETSVAVIPADDPKVDPLPLEAPSPVPTEPADEPAAEDPPCTPVIAAELTVPPAPSEPGVASAIVYAAGGDLFLYDIAADRSAPITANGEPTHEPACYASSPMFLNEHEIVFAAGWSDGIYRLDLATKTLTTIARTRNGVSAIALGLDSTIAYLTTTEEGTPVLKTAPVDGGPAEVLRTFPDVSAAGRCGDMSDEISLAYSPDGEGLLVVATHWEITMAEAEGTASPVEHAKTIHVLRRDGSVAASRTGTHARWSADSRAITYQTFDADGRWLELDLLTGKDRPLTMTRGTHGAAFSPDGRYIAHGSMGSSASMYVYDVETGAERMIATQHAFALWLSPSSLALNRLLACASECHDAWELEETVVRIARDGGTTTRLAITNTSDARALYGA